MIRTWRWRALGALIVIGAIAFLVKGADRPADPVLDAAPASATTSTLGTSDSSVAPTGGRTSVPGFGEIGYRINRLSDTERCALLADTPPRRSQGLMNRRDLAGHDGMLFVFQAPSSDSFYMKNTLIPLSIAWFDANGRFVSSADMEPCLDRADCPLYAATAPYRFALEVPKGGLGALGIGPGSVLTPGAACT